jgi:uncharacterized protein YxeA
MGIILGKKLIILAIIITINLVAAEMPSSFYQVLNNMKNQDILCVKNYDAGASITEAYTDFEHLEKDTQVVSRSYNTSGNEKDYTRGNASLEASIDASVIGNSHIDWQSRDLLPDQMGRRAFYSRAADATTGVFNIEKFIQLWSNSSLKKSAGPEWLPCS